VLRVILAFAGILLGLPWLYIKAIGLGIVAVILLPKIAWKILGRRKEPEVLVT